MDRTVEYKTLIDYSQNPIKVVVDADSTSATICWKYKATISCDTQCGTDEIIGTRCEEVELIPNDTCDEKTIASSITWQNQSILYEIKQKGNPQYCVCEKPFDEPQYELIDYWVNPYVVECNNNEWPNKTKLYYKYNKYTVDETTCEVIRNEISGSSDIDVSCDDVEELTRKTITSAVTFDGIFSEEITYGYACKLCEDECSQIPKIKIGSITYDKEYILCSGGSVGYSVIYTKVVADEDCNKTETMGMVSGNCSFAACDSQDQTKPCCRDHYVTTQVTKQIEGQDVTFNLSILMKADFDGSCDADCNCSQSVTTTYKTAEQATRVLVYYVDNNGIGSWVDNQYCKVPYQGGRIKILFDYTATTQNADCTITTTNGIQEYIMSITTSCAEGAETTVTKSFVYKTATEGCNNTVEYTYYQEECNMSSDGGTSGGGGTVDDNCDNATGVLSPSNGNWYNSSTATRIFEIKSNVDNNCTVVITSTEATNGFTIELIQESSSKFKVTPQGGQESYTGSFTVGYKINEIEKPLLTLPLSYSTEVVGNCVGVSPASHMWTNASTEPFVFSLSPEGCPGIITSVSVGANENFWLLVNQSETSFTIKPSGIESVISDSRGCDVTYIIGDEEHTQTITLTYYKTQPEY